MIIPWDVIFKYAEAYNVDPVLLAAIGAHETKWGELGQGRNGWHTGYGIGQPQYHGLENQVKYTAIKMSKWGMEPGSVSLDRLYQGNDGHLPSGIYATDENLPYGTWPEAVWRYYNSLKTQAVFAGAQTPLVEGGEIEARDGWLDRLTGWYEDFKSPGSPPSYEEGQTLAGKKGLSQGLGLLGVDTPDLVSGALMGVSYVLLVVVLVVAVVMAFRPDMTPVKMIKGAIK